MTSPLILHHRFSKVIIKVLRKLIVLSRITLNKRYKFIALDLM